MRVWISVFGHDIFHHNFRVNPSSHLCTNPFKSHCHSNKTFLSNKNALQIKNGHYKRSSISSSWKSRFIFSWVLLITLLSLICLGLLSVKLWHKPECKHKWFYLGLCKVIQQLAIASCSVLEVVINFLFLKLLNRLNKHFPARYIICLFLKLSLNNNKHLSERVMSFFKNKILEWSLAIFIS